MPRSRAESRAAGSLYSYPDTVVGCGYTPSIAICHRFADCSDRCDCSIYPIATHTAEPARESWAQSSVLSSYCLETSRPSQAESFEPQSLRRWDAFHSLAIDRRLIILETGDHRPPSSSKRNPSRSSFPTGIHSGILQPRVVQQTTNLLVARLSNDGQEHRRMRDLLKMVANQLIKDGDAFMVRFSGPSQVAVEKTMDQSRLQSELEVTPRSSWHFTTSAICLLAIAGLMGRIERCSRRGLTCRPISQQGAKQSTSATNLRLG